MAANLVRSFADLIDADSEFVMPTTDQEVRDAPTSFGAVFRKTRDPAHDLARHGAELLAGLALLHTSALSLPVSAPRGRALTATQQQKLWPWRWTLTSFATLPGAGS
jgi:hypothetical protein